MTFAEIEDQALLAFIALAKAVVRADATLTEAEYATLSRLREEVGEARFNDAMAEAKTKFHNTQAALDSAKLVTDTATQQFLYEELVKVAMSDELVVPEALLLDQLAEKWNVEQ